jgi:hypothetical protein
MDSKSNQALEQFALDVRAARAENSTEIRGRHLASLVLARRRDLGLSVPEAAAAAGLDVQDWSTIEDGCPTELGEALTRQLAGALSIGPEELARELDARAQPSTEQVSFAAELVVGADALLRSLVVEADSDEVMVEAVIDVAVAIHEAALVLGALDVGSLRPVG